MSYFFKLHAQNLEKEMFINRNSINNKFVTNSDIEQLFINKNKDEIQVVLKTKNDSVFSVYIKNNMNKTLKLVPQDNSLYIIQEALDQNKKWKPIEFFGYSTCGNSYERFIDFKENEILHLTTDKYHGAFKTQVRIKLLMNTKVYYSNSTYSSINKSKFEKSNWFLELARNQKNKTEMEIDNHFFLTPNF